MMKLDMIFMKLALENGVNTWWFTDEALQPNTKYQRNLWRIREHEARNWAQLDLNKAVNVVRVYAYYDSDDKCQCYEVGYCEARLSLEDIDDIEKMLRTWADIPF